MFFCVGTGLEFISYFLYLFEGGNLLQTMMQQMIDNPQAMQNFSTAPYVQNLLESMEQDPDMAMRILNMNPTISRNPALQVFILFLLCSLPPPLYGSRMKLMTFIHTLPILVCNVPFICHASGANAPYATQFLATVAKP